jgi:hypothetical protein
MKKRNTIIMLIPMTIALIVTAFTGSIRAAVDGHVINTFLYSVPAFTCGSGQTLRFSAVNPNPVEEGNPSIRVQVKLYDAQGTVIASSREVEVLPGQFRSFDFLSDHLPVAGEPETGHMQLRAEFQIRVDAQAVFSRKEIPLSYQILNTRASSSGSSAGSYYTGTVSVSGDGF